MVKASRKRRQAAKPSDAQSALPAIIEAADNTVVEGAVAEIKVILGRTLAKGMEEVGEYLLKTFYHGDLALFHSHAPAKHASLRALTERCGSMDLPVSPSFLSNAIRLAALAHQLPTNAQYHTLPPSHRVALLPVHDPEKVEELAATAIEKGLTVVGLRESVAKLRSPAEPKRGRPRIAPVVRVARSLVKALSNGETGRLAFLRADIDKLGDDEREDVKASLQRAQDLLNRLAKLLGD